jgi:hypothetical protein
MAEPVDGPAGLIDTVSARLGDLGLIGPLFDPAEVAADLAERLELDRSLDTLIGPGDPGPSGPFDPALR